MTGLTNDEIFEIHEKFKKLDIKLECPCGKGQLMLGKRLQALLPAQENNTFNLDTEAKLLITLTCYDCSRVIFYDYNRLFDEDKTAFKTIKKSK